MKQQLSNERILAMAISMNDWSNDMREEKERILKLITEDGQWSKQEEDIGVDYVAEYKKQTGKDLETGKFVTQ